MSLEQFISPAVILLIFFGFFRLNTVHANNDVFLQIHYGILFSLISLGICSFIFSLTNIQFNSRNISIFGIVFFSAAFFRFWKTPKHSVDLFFSRKSAFLLLTSYLASTVAGLLFYSTDLLPSSMTGDPARHFQRIVQLVETGEALAHKPIYIVIGSLMLKALSWLPKDEAFVAFNIVIFALCTSASMVLFLKLFPRSKYSHIFFVVLFVSFSYPLFSLIFGYYTLLLSAAFLFTAMALMVESKDFPGRRKYIAPTFVILGVVLTHSYLLPDAIISIILFSVWIAKRQNKEIFREFWSLTPFLLLIGLIAIISNSITSYESFQTYKSHIGLRGYVNESFLLNIVPFVPFGLIYLLRETKQTSTQILSVYIGSALIFTLLMSLLYKFDIAAPYYINRNQLVLIPLLIFANFGFFLLVESRRPTLAWSVICLLSIFAFLPFCLIHWNRLPIDDGDFRRLLMDDRFVYAENANIIRFTPLQMSNRDRQMMRKIGQRDSPCIDPGISRMAALGTDHESNWFLFYTGIYPSLFERSDGFIEFGNYEKNYRMWRNDPTQLYIAVLNHFDFWNRPLILRDINFLAELICKGDSISIYKKTSSH